MRLVDVPEVRLGLALEPLLVGVAPRAERRTSKDLQSKLARYEAQALTAASADRRVVTVLEGWDQNGLKTIASAIAEVPGHMAALVGLSHSTLWDTCWSLTA